jgi:hypothetical protein
VDLREHLFGLAAYAAEPVADGLRAIDDRPKQPLDQGAGQVGTVAERDRLPPRVGCGLGNVAGLDKRLAIGAWVTNNVRK